MTPAERDAADPLRAFRARFALPEGVIYLDGNSLGALPVDTPARVARAVADEWGRDLIASWNSADWIGAPARVGAKIARLVGARADEVIVADSVSINLFKLIAAALALRPGRRVVLSEAGNFATDLYMIEGAAGLGGCDARVVARDEVAGAIGEDVALLLLTHVHYKSAAKFDMATLTAAAHKAGALVLWDLSHSTGAVEVDLTAAGADFAVGCGYKYLNGGPGAPGFAYVAQRHHAALFNPLCGWMGHARPFAFEDGYAAAPGVARLMAGTPPILSLVALEAGVDLLLEADMAQVAAKGRALTQAFIDAVSAIGDPDFALASPADAAARGCHVSLAHPHAWPIVRALAERGVIGDFRAPDIARFGFSPLYVGFEDVARAAATLADILATGAWREQRFAAPARVT